MNHQLVNATVTPPGAEEFTATVALLADGFSYGGKIIVGDLRVWPNGRRTYATPEGTWVVDPPKARAPRRRRGCCG